MRKMSRYLAFFLIMNIVTNFMRSFGEVYSFMEFKVIFLEDSVTTKVLLTSVWLIPYFYILGCLSKDIKTKFEDLMIYFIIREKKVKSLVLILLKRSCQTVIMFMLTATIFMILIKSPLDNVFFNTLRLLFISICCCCVELIGNKRKEIQIFFIVSLFVMTIAAVIFDFPVLNELFLNVGQNWINGVIFVVLSPMMIWGTIKRMKKVDF